jgi:Putative lumazine-binding
MSRMAMVFGVLFLAQNAAAQIPGQTPEAEVLAVVNALFDGMRGGDSAKVRPLFHAKARLISVDSRRPGARIEESLEGFVQSIGGPRAEVWDEQLSNVRTMIDGSLASVWADYKFYRGTTFSHCGVDHFLLVKEGSAWKIIELADTRRRENC